MLDSIRKLLEKASKLPLHPQWLANKYHDRKLRLLAELRGSTILDIGSGNRDLSPCLHPSNRLIRSDYPSTSRGYGNRPDLFLDARQLPFDSLALDVVVLFEVLEHVDESQAVLAEIHRVLKQDGKLLISAPFLYPEHDAPYDFLRFSGYGLQRLLKKTGFVVESFEVHGSGLETIGLLFNLYLLHLTRRIESYLGVLVVPFAAIAFAGCLLNNLLVMVLNPLLPNVPAFYLGRTLVARANG